MTYQFEKVFVSKDALKYPITQNVLENIPQDKIVFEDIHSNGKNRDGSFSLFFSMISFGFHEYSFLTFLTDHLSFSQI